MASWIIKDITLWTRLRGALTNWPPKTPLPGSGDPLR